MGDTLRDRITKAIHEVDQMRVCKLTDADIRFVADAVIAALGTRRCERCRNAKPLTDFPDPHDGSEQMRPFCVKCTEYVEWATS